LTSQGEGLVSDQIGAKRTPITEELLVEFLIDHDIQTAEELSEFTQVIRLMFLALGPAEEVTLH